MIGHWPVHDLHARQPSSASLTSCEKSGSPRRRAQVLRRRAGRERQPGGAAQAPALLDRIEAERRELPQPFPDQLGPALGRVPPLARALPGRAHRVVGVPVVAGAVAVAVQRLVEAGPDLGRDGAVGLALHGHAVDREEPAFAGGGDLAGIEPVVRVERRLDRLERRIERAEEARRELRAHALAVLAPEQAAVLPGERDHLLGDLPDQALLLRILEVDRRAHVQDAGVHVAEHAVDEPAAVEGAAELGDVVGEVLRRDGRVFHEGDRPLVALHVAEQADRLLAHRPDALDVLVPPRDGEPAPALGASLGGERVGDPPERDLDLLLGVADELHEVDADGGLAVVVVGEEVADVLPDDVVLGQRQHLGIDGLDRGGAEPDQGLGVAQRGVEAVVAHVDQRGVARDRQHVELGLGQEARACPRSRRGSR